jgi:hypothetical protein
MPELLVGRCRNCDGPVSYFARACPSCHATNLPNPVAIVAALAAVLVIGAGVGLGVWLLGGRSAQAPSSADSTAPGAGTATTEDYGWVAQAMADCEAESKQQLDRLHFLIVPMTTTGVSLPGWTPLPISTIGNVGTLFGAADALLGLRNRVFVLYRTPLAFVISDPDTQKVYKWKAAVGVSRLKSSEIGMTNLKLGFEIPDVGDEIAWGPTIKASTGTCYWINAVINASARPK